jgi:biotin operon repressor
MFRRYPDSKTRETVIITLLKQSPNGLTQADIARILDYPAKMVMEDLQRLEDHGIYLWQDECNRLAIFKIAPH